MKKIYRTTGAVLLFFAYIAGGVVLRLFTPGAHNKRRVSVWWTSAICRAAAAFLRVRVTSSGITGGRGRLIISNHMSYLDILVYSSVCPAVFVSSVEVEKTFFLGFVARIGGTFFVERRTPKNIRGELAGIEVLLRRGFDVVLFPEGTSTDGSKILPFRSSFLAGAYDTGMEIIPACIRYETVNGRIFSAENRDTVCWYGDMSFSPHFFNFISQDFTEVSLSFLPSLDTESSDRKEAARQARELISCAYFGGAQAV